MPNVSAHKRTAKVVLLVALMAMAAAACGTAPVGEITAALGSQPAPHAVGPGAAGATPASRHHEAVVTARRILAETPQTTGESRITDPPKSLLHPSQFYATRNLVTRARYWTVALSPHQTYRQLKAAKVHHLRLSGYGDVGDGGMPPNQAQLNFDALHLPVTIDSAEDFIEIDGQADGSTIIAAFAEVVAHPVRPASEHMATTHVTGTLRRTRYTYPQPGGHQTGHTRTVTLTSKQADAIARLFNQMQVTPPTTCTGGIPFEAITMTLVAHGTTWVLQYPANCAGVDVLKNNKQEPELDPKAGFNHLLDADVKADLRRA
jgi:hypothetical protein